MKRKQKKKKSIILRLVILCVCGYFTITLADLWGELKVKQEEYNQVVIQRDKMVRDIDELKKLYNSDSKEEVIIKAARERLGYTFPDEQVFIDISGN